MELSREEIENRRTLFINGNLGDKEAMPIFDLAIRAKDAEAKITGERFHSESLSIELDKAKLERDQLSAQVGKLLDALKDILRRHRGKHDPDEFVAQKAVLLDAPQCLASLEDRERTIGAEAFKHEATKAALKKEPFNSLLELDAADIVKRLREGK